MCLLISSGGRVVPVSRTNAGVLCKSVPADEARRCGGIRNRMTNVLCVFFSHFFSRFAGSPARCRRSLLRVICCVCARRLDYIFLTAPRAVVPAVKKNQCELIANTLTSSSPHVNAATYKRCPSELRDLLVASDDGRDKRAISIQGGDVTRRRITDPGLELCVLIVAQHYAQCLRLNNPVCGS